MSTLDLPKNGPIPINLSLECDMHHILPHSILPSFSSRSGTSLKPVDPGKHYCTVSWKRLGIHTYFVPFFRYEMKKCGT